MHRPRHGLCPYRTLLLGIGVVVVSLGEDKDICSHTHHRGSSAIGSIPSREGIVPGVPHSHLQCNSACQADLACGISGCIVGSELDDIVDGIAVPVRPLEVAIELRPDILSRSHSLSDSVLRLYYIKNPYSAQIQGGVPRDAVVAVADPFALAVVHIPLAAEVGDIELDAVLALEVFVKSGSVVMMSAEEECVIGNTRRNCRYIDLGYVIPWTPRAEERVSPRRAVVGIRKLTLSYSVSQIESEKCRYILRLVCHNALSLLPIPRKFRCRYMMIEVPPLKPSVQFIAQGSLLGISLFICLKKIHLGEDIVAVQVLKLRLFYKQFRGSVRANSVPVELR